MGFKEPIDPILMVTLHYAGLGDAALFISLSSNVHSHQVRNGRSNSELVVCQSDKDPL